MNPLMISWMAEMKHKDYERQFKNKWWQIDEEDKRPRPSVRDRLVSLVRFFRLQTQSPAKAKAPARPVSECFDPMPVQPCPDAV